MRSSSRIKFSWHNATVRNRALSSTVGDFIALRSPELCLALTAPRRSALGCAEPRGDRLPPNTAPRCKTSRRAGRRSGAEFSLRHRPELSVAAVYFLHRAHIGVLRVLACARYLVDHQAADRSSFRGSFIGGAELRAKRAKLLVLIVEDSEFVAVRVPLCALARSESWVRTREISR